MVIVIYLSLHCYYKYKNANRCDLMYLLLPFLLVLIIFRRTKQTQQLSHADDAHTCVSNSHQLNRDELLLPYMTRLLSTSAISHFELCHAAPHSLLTRFMYPRP